MTTTTEAAEIILHKFKENLLITILNSTKMRPAQNECDSDHTV